VVRRRTIISSRWFSSSIRSCTEPNSRRSSVRKFFADRKCVAELASRLGRRVAIAVSSSSQLDGAGGRPTVNFRLDRIRSDSVGLFRDEVWTREIRIRRVELDLAVPSQMARRVRLGRIGSGRVWLVASDRVGSDKIGWNVADRHSSMSPATDRNPPSAATTSSLRSRRHRRRRRSRRQALHHSTARHDSADLSTWSGLVFWRQCCR